MCICIYLVVQYTWYTSGEKSTRHACITIIAKMIVIEFLVFQLWQAVCGSSTSSAQDYNWSADNRNCALSHTQVSDCMVCLKYSLKHVLYVTVIMRYL